MRSVEMRCPKCAHENRPQAKFCAGCGAALPRGCAQCGAEIPAGARFCDTCGAAVGDPAPTPPAAAAPTPVPGSYTPRHLAEKILTSRSAIEGERKLVTVLFADVAGFTALSSRLDPEDLHGVMDGCFQRVMEAVHRFEGTINQFTGDGVMALFGAPIAHEDHARRAVAAAVEMQRALADYAAELRRTRGLEFGMRIGLNTGRVVVGKIGDDLRMDYTAQGETVNVAARLQAAGTPGAVLMSESTYRLVARQFTTEEVPPLTVKGIARPLRAFTVTGERARRVRFDAVVEQGLTPFVGRQRGLSFLDDCFERVTTGHGQVVSLAGDAGIGKSRLAHEFRLRLASVDCRQLRAGCAPHGEGAPFRVIFDLLRASFAIEEAEPAAVQIDKLERGVAALDPALAWTLPHAKLLLALPAPELDAQGLDPQQRKLRTLEAFKALVLRASENRPLLLLIEDLQWVDRSSLDALRVLVDGLADRRVLLLGTYRTGFEPPWQDRSFHQRLALEPLSPRETQAIAEALLPLPAHRDLLVSRGDGNPFFVEEIASYLRTLAEDALAKDLAERGVPDTIQDLLTARIDRLAEPVKRTLQRASVLGREFALRWLEVVAAPGDDVREHVATLVAGELLRETHPFPEPRLSFTQSLIRDVAYAGLLMKSRAELHARAAAAIESAYGTRLDEVLPDLARHYAQTTDHAKALHYAVRLGDRAATLFANDEALESYAGALHLAESHPPLAAERSRVLDRMGDAAFAQGEVDASLAHWEKALRTLPENAPPAIIADLHRKRAVARWAAGQTRMALDELDRGLEALGADRQNLAAARIYQELGRFHFRLGKDEDARRFAGFALELGERLGAPDVVSHAYNTLGVAEAREGDLAAGAATVAKSLATALDHDLAALACRAYTNLAVLTVTVDHERSATYCREGLELARRIGDQLQQSWLHCAMAGGHCTLSGDYDEGVKRAEAAIELDRRLGQRSHLPIPIIILAQIYQCRGDYEQSDRRYREALELAESIGEPQLLFPCYDGLATLAIEAGDETAADEWLRRSREVQDRAGWTSDSFFVVPFLC